MITRWIYGGRGCFTLILDYISEILPHSERRSGYDNDESLYDHDERESPS